MILPIQLRRLVTLGILLLLGFSVLLGRLVYIQVFCHDDLSAKALRHTQRTYLKQTRRGDIFDRKGALLASTQGFKILCADPSRIGRYYKILAKVLAKRLGVNEDELRERLRPRGFVNEKGERMIDPHVRLKVRVSERQWARIREFMKRVNLADESLLSESERDFLASLRKRGIFAEPIEGRRRVYLNGELASHILGFVQTEERVVGGQSVFFSSGKAGIEASFDSHLQGTLGWRTTETDSRRRELVALRRMDVAAVDGLNVHLTIDAGAQAIVEDELAKGIRESSPLSATVIVIRPMTGEILALANYPSFDPNHPGEYPANHRRNRAISDAFEPGSTFKIVSIASALDEKVVRLQSEFDCENGYLHFKGRPLRDDHPYSILTLKDILKKSSNIGAFKAVRRLGEKRLYDSLKRFGIGEATGVGLPAERKGTLRPISKWSGLSISRVPIGYEVAVTPLQITMAMGAIANGGWLMSPMLVSHLSDSEGKMVMRYHPEKIRQVISPQTAQSMTAALEGVVEEGGTATRARLEHWTVAGKTGTARKYVPKVGYSWRKYNASFIGFFPSERAELLISVIFNEPKGSIYGGMISAPIFKEIAKRLANYLNVPPSIELLHETRWQQISGEYVRR